MGKIGLPEELPEIIEQIAALSQRERTFIEDLPDHFRRMVLHLGSLRKLLGLLRKSIRDWQWQDQEEMVKLLQRLQKEVDPEKGLITDFVYAYTSFAPLQRLDRQKLEEEEKITFRFYDDLAHVLERSPHHPQTAAKLRKIQEQLAGAMRKEKIAISVSAHLASLLEKFHETLEVWKEKLKEEKSVLQTIQEQLVGPLLAAQLPLLRECAEKLQGHLRYRRELQVHFNEKFYKPFRKFLTEEFKIKDRLTLILEGRRRWYPLYRQPQITRQDFMLDYYTFTSPDDVLEYIMTLEELGPGYVALDLQQFLRRNRKRLLERIRVQQATSTQKVAALGKDSLTGLYTRGTIDQRLAELIELEKRIKMPFSLLMIDVDYFKKINDTYGHPAGDRVLQKVAQALEEVQRKADFLGRYGGEEFLVLLPHTNKEQAAAAAERFRENVSRRNKEPVNPITQGPITVSIGLATFPDDGTSSQELIDAADKALYQAKGRGRNVVVAA
ncbi:MAG: GGDEF domain-containing protein [Nanoarchaeota archaeon]